ncbi:MAG: hypothetical protein FWC79_06970 [Oscillospiraceae bacterium]|nr:hypothetical protein [Oscillospiraceae bacterium]
MGTQMTVSCKEAYAQVLEVIKHMRQRDVEKIPATLRDFFETNSLKEYEFRIDPSIPLREQNLNEKTLDLLAMLNINFWCETESQKKTLISKYADNEKRYQEELREKYNPEKVFKSRQEENEAIDDIEELRGAEEKLLIERRHATLFGKMVSKIKEFFSKNRR